MTDERRKYPRLNTHMVWRAAGLRAPRQPTVDLSAGGMLVYSDDSLSAGARLEIELFVAGAPPIELQARVVRVDVLPEGAPARFDVALEFLEMSAEARTRLGQQLGVVLPPPLGLGPLSPPLASDAGSQARVHEQQGDQVREVEGQHGDEGLLEAPASVPFARGPHGDHYICQEDRNQQELLHCSDRPSSAHGFPARNLGRGVRSRLRVLFVTPYLPSPPRFGGQRRLHGLIEGLSRSHEVSVLSLVNPAEDQTESLRETEVYCRHVAMVPSRRVAAGPTAKRLLQLGSLLSKRSYEWLLHREETFDAALDQLLAMEHFDVVQFEFPHMAAYRTKRLVTEALGPAFVLDEHNIEYDVVRQTARAGGGALRRAYSAINWPKVHAEERHAWAKLDGCTLTSERDRGLLLQEAPDTRTAVVPNGVDLDFFQAAAPVARSERQTLLYFGAIDYHPNTDAVLFFLREVFPLLADRSPPVTLMIVGRRPPESITSLAGPRVIVTGAVDDIRTHIADASVVIAPLRMGGGTRLKIIEAMAMGKAVVSTSLGAEGLDVVEGRDLLIADDPAGFAGQIRRLLDDPALAARIGEAARRLVSERYGWRASVDRLSAFHAEVIEAREAR